MSAELIQSKNSIRATTPEAWESAMKPIAAVRVQEVLGRQFSANLQLFDLPRTAVFSLRLPSARVVVPDGSGFVGVTFVSKGQMRTASPSRGSQWDTGTVHVIDHDDYKYDFTSDEHLDSMAFCFKRPLLQQYSQKFFGRDDARLEQATADFVLDSSAGECFARYAKFVWGELHRGGAFLRSPLATEEIEESLWALLLSAVHRQGCEDGNERGGGYATYVRPAEEFILGNLNTAIRVADIAEAVGVSVPTLNRAFRKCHGMGPKAFAKLRRLDCARATLQCADTEATSVTEVATKLGFWHLSQFAADYKRAFGETPSETLRRK